MNQAQQKPFYLRDNFAPVEQEISDDNLQVIGSIPPALNGRFLRNGPNTPSLQYYDVSRLCNHAPVVFRKPVIA